METAAETALAAGAAAKRSRRSELQARCQTAAADSKRHFTSETTEFWRPARRGGKKPSQRRPQSQSIQKSRFGPPFASLPRMDPLTAIAASGLRARMESLDLLANNVANASTGGYKADREFYSLYAAPEAESSSTMPVIERPWVDLSQGLIHSTGNPLDVALTGRGFFAVSGPSGPLYTRNGSFQLTAEGRLVTADGYAVRGAAGAPLVLRDGRTVEIDRDGTVRQDGDVAGKLELVDFTNPGTVVKHGNNYFRANAPPAPLPKGAAVEQGKLEASNTGSAEAAVRLVSVMRQFEMLQKAATLGAEMNRAAVEQVARVGN
jgi:flagellar basal-body rod protein FlgF